MVNAVFPSTAPLSQPELQQRLQDWSLDPPGSAWSFEQTLARDQRWRAEYAARVVTEYRRFVYLAVAAGHPVCPSEAVDQAWHQHLLETRGYWLEFCPEVLGQPLHHTPSRGGEAERRKLEEWYRRTLASYQASFGETPPVDIWPPLERRFGAQPQAPAPRRFGPQLRALRPSGPPRLQTLALLATLGLGIGGCRASGAPDLQALVMALSGPEFLGAYGLLIGAALVLILLLRWGIKGEFVRARPRAAATSVDLGYLGGGDRQAAFTALLNLAEAGDVALKDGFATLGVLTNRRRDELEEAVVKELRSWPLGTKEVGTLLQDLIGQPGLIGPLRQRLQQEGLVVTNQLQALIRAGEVLVLAPVMALGLVRLGGGLMAGRPVGYLLMELGLLALAWTKLAQNPVRATRWGQLLLARRRALIGRKAPEELGKDLPEGYAVLGMAALPAVMVADLALPKPQVRGGGESGGGEGGGGCGGGGCGGGCGGCGGGCGG